MWYRALQIGSGIISLTLSMYLLAIHFPVLEIYTIITLLSITLLTIGIERVATGILLLKLYSSLPKATRSSGRSKKITPITNMALGAVAIGFAIVALILPNLVITIPLTLLSIAISVMFNGFARLMQGALDRSQPTWFRAFSLGIGSLCIGSSIVITNYKMFGIIFPIRALFVILLIYGIGMIFYGVRGKFSLDEILKKKIHRKDE